MSITGLKNAMRAVLDRHRGTDRVAAPAGKPLFVQDIPGFAASKQAKEACYHCHYANNARLDQLRLEGRFSKELLFQYPYPENIGLTLDPDRNNTVRSVVPASPAARAGIQAGDVITRAGDVRVLTEADLQFALEPVSDPGKVTLTLSRAGKSLAPVALDLPRGWRKSDISWRASQGDIPPTVGMWAEPLSGDQKRSRGIAADRLALRVSFMFPGAHWAKTRGDLKLNDVVIGINGEELSAMTTRQFHSYFRLRFNVGDRVTLNVLRGAQRIDIAVVCQDRPVE